ncbi:MAG TPA: HAD family hydrolase [Acidimicrobiales bacterium]|nr:HAD family hydrolase [Acidimicrobiales bacterium]
MIAVRPDAVVFDVGGVFVLPTPVVLRPALAALGVVPSDDDAVFHRAHYEATAALDAGFRAGLDREARWAAYLRTYATVATCGAEVAPAAFEPAWRSPALEVWSWVQRPAVAALRRLVAAGVPVAIVSNADGTVEELLRRSAIAQVGPGDGVEVLHVVDSHVVGVEKPDPATFAPALAVLADRGIDPHRCVYLGDTAAADVVGARAAGMHPVQLDPYGICADDGHDRVPSVDALVDAVLGS